MKEITIKKRESNFELLRIIAMLLVMITHATFLALGVPTHDDSINIPYSSFTIIFYCMCKYFCFTIRLVRHKDKFKTVFRIYLSNFFLYKYYFYRTLHLFF